MSDPVTWVSDIPEKGITKPGLVVSSATLCYGPGTLPCVGKVRGIFIDAVGTYRVRVQFPADFGVVGTFYAHEVSGHYPKDWESHGDWTALIRYRQHCSESRRARGLSERPGAFADHLLMPANFS